MDPNFEGVAGEQETDDDAVCASYADETKCRGAKEKGKSCSWDGASKKCYLSDVESIKPYKIPDTSSLNPANITDFRDLIGQIINTAIGVIGSIALAMFVYGGFVTMTGMTDVGGGANKVDVMRGKAILVWSTLGIIVVTTSYFIVDFVFEAFR